MSLASRRRLMIYKSFDDPIWNNRIGYFNKSYTMQNDWWLNGNYNDRIVSCMNYAKNQPDALKDYFYVINLSGAYYLYVSDTPFYVIPTNNTYCILQGKNNSYRFANGNSKQQVNQTEYGQKDGVIYSRDHANRAASVLDTIITNYPIFAWTEDIPSEIPSEGGAVTNLYT